MPNHTTRTFYFSGKQWFRAALLSCALFIPLTNSIMEASAQTPTDSDQKAIARGETQNVDARKSFLIGWEHYLQFNPDDDAKAIPYFEKAVELDGAYGRAYAALALIYMRGYSMNWDEDYNEESIKVRIFLQRDAAIYPTSLASVVASQFHLYFAENEEGLAAAARALTLDPDEPEAHLAMAWALITTGRADDGIVSIRTAMRLNPRYTSQYSHALGVAYFVLGQFDEAARVLREAFARNSLAIDLAPPLAAAYAWLGRRSEARAVLDKWGANANDPALASKLAINSMPFLNNAKTKRTREALIDGVRLALLPQDVTIEVLADALKNGNTGERRGAARKIGLFGPMARDAVDVLIDAMKDENRFVRREAISALGKIGRPAKVAVEALKAALQDPAMRSRAEAALKRITGE